MVVEATGGVKLFVGRVARIIVQVTLTTKKIQLSTTSTSIWSNYSDLTRPHPKWRFSKGNPLISGKSGLVKYYNNNLTRSIEIQGCHQQTRNRRSSCLTQTDHTKRIQPVQPSTSTTSTFRSIHPSGQEGQQGS